MGKKATVLQVGAFDEEGYPDGNWKFEENVRLVKKPDGTYSMGGYSNDELLLLMEQEKDKQEQAQEAAREGESVGEEAPGQETEPEALKEPEVSDAPDQTGEEAGVVETAETVENPEPPTPYRAPDKQFIFWATITGVAAKKPPKLRTHKEIKLLSPDLSELSEIDGLMDCEVKVVITRPRHNAYFSETADADKDSGLQQQELFEGGEDGSDDAPVTPHMPEGGPAAPDVQLNPSDVHETPENADEAGIDPEADQTKEVAGDGETGVSSEVQEQEPTTKLVCSACGGDLLVNEDDPAQLICVDCGTIHENAAAQPLELE